MSVLGRDMFDADDIRKEDMEFMADHIEEYLELLQEVMIIPDEILDEQESNIKRSIKIVEKLIEKLRKGDRSVFKDVDDYNSIL